MRPYPGVPETYDGTISKQIDTMLLSGAAQRRLRQMFTAARCEQHLVSEGRRQERATSLLRGGKPSSHRASRLPPPGGFYPSRCWSRLTTDAETPRFFFVSGTCGPRQRAGPHPGISGFGLIPVAVWRAAWWNVLKHSKGKRVRLYRIGSPTGDRSIASQELQSFCSSCACLLYGTQTTESEHYLALYGLLGAPK
ncbi:hypothetical protein LZ31DRAFT_300128 [Colletotrichum somersetense]|nr:hypothetical protein LZ31DRAFT_300128 [Colletotrichum somersetense]